jgi:hypothetical protein
VSLVVEHLPSKHEALSSSTSTTPPPPKKRKKNKLEGFTLGTEKKWKKFISLKISFSSMIY